MHKETQQVAVLDDAHIGDIRGALGTIAHGDTAARRNFWHRLRTLLAILGPGLIVMVGDNDAGAFSTYAQAGQNYGTTLLWTLALLIPVLYVNQEMVLRLGAVTGVGHARLILERFGKFWGAFSAIDLFILNALTLVTEFIGISLALNYLGVPKVPGVIASAGLIMLAVSTGDFRRFERFSLILVFASMLLIPVLVMVHPPIAQIGKDLLIPGLPADGKLSDVMLLIIGIVGTTVAPWQLFFQQSYVIDKRVTPRFIRYERVDLWLGIVLVIVGAVAIIAIASAIFANRPEFGNFQDAGAVAAALAQYHSPMAGMMFAIALIDASLIGASAVSLSTAYAVADVLSLKHSLHRKPTDAKAFYAIYALLIAAAAALVLIPGVPLGLLTNAVQTLAGVLLPSASVFLLLLCNDKEVLGPWINKRFTNIVTGAIVSVLVTLSIILTAAVMWPDISGSTITAILIGGCIAGLVIVAATQLPGQDKRHDRVANKGAMQGSDAANWRMPPLSQLKPLTMSLSNKVWLGVLRVYLVVAVGMVIYKVIEVTTT